MSRLTLRLPDSLHQQLESLADNEQVSLNQYIVYALTRQVTLDYTIQAVPEKALAEQRAQYTTLLQTLGQASFEEIQKALDNREQADLDPGLTPEVAAALRKKFSNPA
jgi:predicted transcriptional regulator